MRISIYGDVPRNSGCVLTVNRVDLKAQGPGLEAILGRPRD
jgi:hypothetical protein